MGAAVRQNRHGAMPAQPRGKALAEIHIAAQALGMDTVDASHESEYRRMLHTHGRVYSASELDHAGRAAVIAHLRRLLQLRGLAKGGKPAARRQPKAAPDRAALMSKVTALLAEEGRPTAYADGMAKRMFRVDAVEFLLPHQLHKLVAALVYDQQRRGQRDQADQAC